MRLFILVVVLLIPAVVHGQSINCSGDDVRIRFTLHHQMTVPCDTMYLLSKATYQRLYVRNAQLEQTNASWRKAHEQLESVLTSSDSLLSTYRADISALESHLDRSSDTSQQLLLRLQESTDLTDHVIEVARRNNRMGYLIGGAGGVVLGIVIGSLVL